MVSSAAARALADIASRASDVMRAFTPGAVPLNNDSVTQAQTQWSSDPLSVAAPKNSYFIAAEEHGRHMYTRDGQFGVYQSTLVDRYNRPLMGFKKHGESLEALRIDPVDAALHRAKDVHIEANGSVSYTRSLVDPRTGEAHSGRVTVGRLALARFPAASQLQPLDATRSLAPPGVVPHVGLPGDGNFEKVTPNAREGSRLSFTDSIEKLREAYLALDALRSVQTVQGKVEKTTLDLVK